MKPSEITRRKQAIYKVHALVRTVDQWAELERLRVAKEKIINRVGAKINLLRQAPNMPAQEFVTFRLDLYNMPEDDREAAVDAKLAEKGLTGAE